MPERRAAAPVWALALPFLLALFVHWPALSGGFVSDDYWFSFLLSKGPDASKVLWSEAFADFGRGWPGLESSFYYRPLITLNFAFLFSIGGTSGFVFHLSNLLQHGVAVILCAWLCGKLAREHKGLAACIGGTILAVHPVSVEPVAWVASMTSTQELMLRMFAISAYFLSLERRSRVPLLTSAGFFVLALLTKESAIVLPISLLALEVLTRMPGGLRSMLRRLLPFVLLGLAFLLFRRLMPSIHSGGSLAFLETFFGNLADSFPSKFRYLLFPFDSGIAFALGASFSIACLLWLLRGASRIDRGLWLFFGFALWIFLHFATSAHEKVSPDYYGSRMVYDALPAFALAIAVLGFGHRESKRALVAVALLLLALCVSFAHSARLRIADYESTWSQIDKLRTALDESGRDASREQPLALLSLPPDSGGCRRIFPDFAFPLAEQPWNRRDLPFVSLAAILTELTESKELLHDAGPIRAMYERGASILVWNQATQSFDRMQRGEAPASVLLRMSGARARFVNGPIDPFAVEAVRLRLRGKGEKLRLGILGPGLASKPLTIIEPALRTEEGNETELVFDLTHEITLLALKGAGSAGFSLEGLSTGEGVVAIRAMRRVDSLPLVDALAGKTLRIADFEKGLARPRPNADGSASKLDHLILITPASVYRIPIDSELRARIPQELRHFHRRTARASRGSRFYYYYEGKAVRSEVDDFVLR